VERRAPAAVGGVATSAPVGAAYEASVLIRVDAGHGAHRTLLARASGDDVAALRVIEAGDHVVLDGRLVRLGPGAYDERARWRHAARRVDEARVRQLSAPRGLLAGAASL